MHPCNEPPGITDAGLISLAVGSDAGVPIVGVDGSDSLGISAVGVAGESIGAEGSVASGVTGTSVGTAGTGVASP